MPHLKAMGDDRVVPNDMKEIDYEMVVRELHARIGTRVFVSVGSSEGGYGAATIMGPLNRAQDVDMAQALPEILGDRGGESLIFMVGEPGLPVMGTFVLWRPGFQWGRVWESAFGPAVSFAVENIAVRVMPGPPVEVMP